MNQAQIKYIDPVNGSDSTGDGTYNGPYASLTKAMSEISGPCQVIIFPGETTEPGVDPITLKKNVSIYGAGRSLTKISRAMQFQAATNDVGTIEICDLEIASGITVAGEENTNVNLILKNCKVDNFDFTPAILGSILGNVFAYNCDLQNGNVVGAQGSYIFASRIIGGIIQLQAGATNLYVNGCVVRDLDNYGQFNINDDAVLTVVGCVAAPFGNGNYAVRAIRSGADTPEIRYDSASKPGSYADLTAITKTKLSLAAECG